MSKTTTKQSIAGAYAEIDSLRTTMHEGFERLLAAVEGKAVTQPAKATKPAKKGKKAKAEAPKGPSFKDLQAALKAHKAAGAIRAGITVKESIAEGLMTPEGNLSDGTKPSVTVVVAKTQASAPAKRKVTKKQRRAARKLAQTAPRRANGTIAPKSEWVIRQTLAEAGFSPAEVDERTEQALSLLASV